MHSSVVILLLFIFVKTLDTMQCPNQRTPLGSIRKRRYLNFPAKTDMVLTMSLLKAFMTHAPSGWNLALEVDVIFPMPDANFTNAHWRRKLHHRQKREFWERIQNAIDLHNVNGRSCVLRSVCEAKKYLAPPGKSLVHDILRAVFTCYVTEPFYRAPIHEDDFNNEMEGAYDEILNPYFCEGTPECPFSIIECLLSLNKISY